MTGTFLVCAAVGLVFLLVIVACVRYAGQKVQRFIDSAVPRRDVPSRGKQ